jgi:hypothetical protein
MWCYRVTEFCASSQFYNNYILMGWHAVLHALFVQNLRQWSKSYIIPWIIDLKFYLLHIIAFKIFDDTTYVHPLALKRQIVNCLSSFFSFHILDVKILWHGQGWIVICMPSIPSDGHMQFCCITIDIGNYFTEVDAAAATGMSWWCFSWPIEKRFSVRNMYIFGTYNS